MRPLTIYVAGPYSAPTPEAVLENCAKAIDIGLQIWDLGHYPYIPHLNWMVEDRAKHLKRLPFTWDDWMQWDRPWLDKCDALYYIAPSKGTDLELGIAQAQGKPIFYSIEELKGWMRNEY